MNHPREQNGNEESLYPNIDLGFSFLVSEPDSVNNEAPPLQNSSINSAHDPKAEAESNSSSTATLHNTPSTSSIHPSFDNSQHNDTDSILNSLTRKKNKNLSPVFTRDYQGASGSPTEVIRKGWKGLSSLEKSLSVSLGVVSSLCIALMIAVIVVGVQLNEQETCLATTPPGPGVTPPVTAAPPDDRCNTTVRPRPPRRSTTTAKPIIFGGLPPPPSTCMVSTYTTLEASSPKNSTICLTPACSRMAGEILSKLDTSANPCQNFYQFACGGRLKTDPVLGKVRDQSQVVRARLLASVKEILEVNHSQNATRSIYMAQQYYHACMNPLKDDEVAFAEMRILLNTMTSVPTPPTIETEGISPKMQSLAIVLANIRRFLNGNYIVKLEVNANDKNSTENAIYLNHPEFGLPGILRKMDIIPPAVEDTPPGMLDRTTQLYRNLVKRLWSLVYPEDTAYLGNILTKLEEFEGRLKQISDEADDNENPEEYNSLKQVEDTQQLSPTMVAWLKNFSNNVMIDRKDLGEAPNVILKNLRYFQGLEEILNDTMEETIGKYLKLHILLTYAHHSGEVFADLFANFKSKVEMNMGTVDIPRWQTCAEETNRYFGWTLSYHLVQSSLNKMAILKQHLHETTYYLKDSLNETLSLGLPWMATNATRELGQIKLKKLRTFLAFPVDWLFSLSTEENTNNGSGSSLRNAFVEEFYSEMNFSDALNYMQNYVEATIWRNKKELGQVYQAVNFTWPQFQYPSSTQAMYSEKLNYLAFPFGVIDMFSLADFTSTIPSIQYGSVGVLMAQLLLQGFDEQGSYRGSSGNIALWWDTETRENFQNISSCFKNQFFGEDGSMSSNFTENKLLRQVMLQNAALSLAYQAYHSKTFDEPYDEYLLPGLQSFTSEQLYFLTFAQSQCSSKNMVENAISNSFEFAKHFKCPKPSLENVCTIM